MSAPTQTMEREDEGPQVKDKRPPLSPTRRRLSGLVLLLIMALIVALCIANFNKVFKPVDTVYLRTDTVGNQLSKQGDVKVRGVIVGEIKSVDSDGSGAVIEMAMDPDFLPTIPSNTTAMLIPKTLFGERYVSLSIPPNGSARPLEEGDTIAQDRSQNATETEQVLNNLLPVLTAVQPEKLSDTLGAVSQALSGRGKNLGNTLVLLNQYVEGVIPALPDLQANLRALAPTADIYNQASPDLILALDNLVTTSRTLVEQRAAFESTFRSVTSASDTTTAFLAANRENIIELAATSRPILELLARYSSEFPCLFRQLTDLTPKINEVLKPDTGIQIDAEITIDRGKYVPGEEPRYLDTRGPRCYQIQGQAPQDPPGGPIQDGSNHPEASRSTQDAYAGGQGEQIDQDSQTGDESASAARTGGQNGGGQTEGQAASGRVDGANIGLPNSPNSPEERGLVTEVTAMQMGITPAQVPSFAPYLTASTLRGAPAVVR
ncbi:ABC transporter substrate-binding protein [Actinomycetospora sp. NBRC 106375]|uniref:MCE family protein n=1 Tax=Actinomycetospora sp. NBRC 106375 TaxID=3032207 RepID=UPI0024A2A5E0|nr:MCE family protein [Actinomycetospora sp. NBRC 106375]GLZ44662.1 ABC transporter substrate-binding protein [Actinomycetospora sp. NBRC 106375]